MIETKRVYEPLKRADGKRLLVERLWARGIKKADLPLSIRSRPAWGWCCIPRKR